MSGGDRKYIFKIYARKTTALSYLFLIDFNSGFATNRLFNFGRPGLECTSLLASFNGNDGSTAGCLRS